MNGVGIYIGTTALSAAVWEEGGYRLLPPSAQVAMGPSGYAYRERKLPELQGTPELTLWLEQGTARAGLGIINGRRKAVNAGGNSLGSQVADSLTQLRMNLEEHLHSDVTGTTLCTPAVYGMNQTAALRTAAESAGFTEVSLIHEPLAAALHEYRDDPRNGNILIYCLGSSVFSASVLSLDNGKPSEKNHEGSIQLGGQDFEGVIVQKVVEKIHSEYGIDVTQDRSAMRSLIERARQAKLDLNTNCKVELLVGPGSDIMGQHFEYPVTITDEEFREWTSPLIGYTIALTRKAIDGAGLQPGDISEVLLLGGGTHSPHVEEEIRAALGRPVRFATPEAVVVGAARRAASQYNCFVTRVGREPVPPTSTRSKRKSAPALKRKVVEKDQLPDNLEEDDLLIALHKAKQLEAKGDIKATIKAYKELHDEVKKSISYFYCRLASYSRESGDFEKAKDQLEIAAKFYRDNPQIKRSRAQLHFEKAMELYKYHPDDAVYHIKKSLDNDPENPKAKGMLKALKSTHPERKKPPTVRSKSQRRSKNVKKDRR